MGWRSKRYGPVRISWWPTLAVIAALQFLPRCSRAHTPSMAAAASNAIPHGAATGVRGSQRPVSPGMRRNSRNRAAVSIDWWSAVDHTGSALFVGALLDAAMVQ